MITPQTNKNLRDAISSSMHALELISSNAGFERATKGLDELSDMKHNQGDSVAAETLRWAAKELRGENA
jgi:hypothetical protein